MSNSPHSRRTFLGCCAAATIPATIGAGAVVARAQQQPPPEAENLTHYQIGPHIWLRWNNQSLTSYRAHPTQKYPYFYPLTGPRTGLSLTSESALPWPHHRSLFLGCDRVNGGNFWQAELEAGQIVSQGPRVGTTTAQSAELWDECVWCRPHEEPPMSDSRRFLITVPDPHHRLIDADITWRALRDVTIERTNHALFSLRAAIDITPWGGGTLVSSEGAVGEAATFGKPARWCGFYGKRGSDASAPMEGIALLEHPQNPWPDCPWFTRDYGFISPMPFQWLTEPWHLPAGASVRLRYRVVLHAGDPVEAGLEELYTAWVRDTS